MTRRRNVFCSITAQRDNLGDIVIRQVFLDWLAASEGRMHVFVGDMPQGYLDGFDLPVGVKLYRSPSGFELGLLWQALRGRAHLAFAPGPLGILSGRRTWPKSLVNLLNALLVRGGGGQVVVLGRAVRGQARPARDVERLLARASTVCVVRDHESVAILRGPSVMAPDLAFAARDVVTSATPVRDRLALSFRGDRPPPTALVRSLAEQALEAGLRPLLVTQVGSDHVSHESLSVALGIEHLGWDGRDARSQLVAVRTAYAACAVVVSDRLHALLLGTIAGATPVGATFRDSDKLQATLEPVISLPLVDREATAAPAALIADAAATRGPLSQQLETARGELERVRLRVHEALRT